MLPCVTYPVGRVCLMSHAWVLTAALHTQPCISFWPVECTKQAGVLRDSCFLFPCLPDLCYYRHDTSRSNCCGKALPNFNVSCCSVSCCHRVSVIELIIPCLHYLSVFSFWIYCSEGGENHLANLCGEMKTKSGFVWFPGCLWEVPELSGRLLLCGQAKLNQLIPSCSHMPCASLSKHGVVSLCFVFSFQLSL